LHLGTTTPGRTFYLGLTVRFASGRNTGKFNKTINNNLNSNQNDQN